MIEASSVFYRPRISWRELLDTAQEVCAHSYPLFGATLATKLPLDKWPAHLTKGRRRTRGFKVSGTNPILIQVPMPQQPLLKQARIFVFEREPALGLVTLVGLADEFRPALKAVQDYLVTDVDEVFLQTSDFKRVLAKLSEGPYAVKIGVGEFTAHVLSDDEGRVKTRREWLPCPKDQAEFFQEAAEQGLWIRSLGLQLSRTTTSRARIKRDLSFSCDSGFELFFATLYKELTERASIGRKVFEGRGSTQNDMRASRPMQIRYDRKIFDDKRHNHRLIDVLRRLPSSGLSVYHPNPYLHASVVDYTDGSSYSIWVTDDSSIEIVPKRRASAGSLERIFNHISVNFGEGSIEEIKE